MMYLHVPTGTTRLSMFSNGYVFSSILCITLSIFNRQIMTLYNINTGMTQRLRILTPKRSDFAKFTLQPTLSIRLEW